MKPQSRSGLVGLAGPRVRLSSGGGANPWEPCGNFLEKSPIAPVCCTWRSAAAWELQGGFRNCARRNDSRFVARVDAARAKDFEGAVKWFDTDNCAVHWDRRAKWNLDAVLRRIVPSFRGFGAEPTLEAVFELEQLLLSTAEPGRSRRLFDGLRKRWCRGL